MQNILNKKSKSTKLKTTTNNLSIIKDNRNSNNNLYNNSSIPNKDNNNRDSKDNKESNSNKNRPLYKSTRLQSNNKSNKNNKSPILFHHFNWMNLPMIFSEDLKILISNKNNKKNIIIDNNF